MSARKRPSPDALVDGILAGRRADLARAITLCESTLASDRAIAEQVVDRSLPHSGRSIRVGITGVPGVGKSTFIEALGRHITQDLGGKVAVLAVDPSSPLTGGSILGDKTRMTRLSTDPNAFIRPSPSGGSLGGVTQRTREAILLCEAAGFDNVLVETVGVGQSEVAVASMTDFFLLLLLANAGDELQGIKRGVIELADLLVINKADGANKAAAALARKQYENAVQFLPAAPSNWRAQVMTCSALKGENIEAIWRRVAEYRTAAEQSGYFAAHRRDQMAAWMDDAIEQALHARFYAKAATRAAAEKLREAVKSGAKSPFEAARELLEKA